MTNLRSNAAVIDYLSNLDSSYPGHASEFVANGFEFPGLNPAREQPLLFFCCPPGTTNLIVAVIDRSCAEDLTRALVRWANYTGYPAVYECSEAIVDGDIDASEWTVKTALRRFSWMERNFKIVDA